MDCASDLRETDIVRLSFYTQHRIMKTTIINGFIVTPYASAKTGTESPEQEFVIATVDRSSDANKHYRTIASEFAKKTGFKVNATSIAPDTNGDVHFYFTCIIPESPDYQFNPDEKDADIAGLSKWFELDSKFVQGLHDKLTNKGDIFLACQFFKDGILAYDIATGDDPIDIPTIRANYIAGLEKQRKSGQEIADYYNGCKTVTIEHSQNQYREIAFIRDGRLVAFGQFTRDHRGGIYAANNDVQKIPNWNAHEHVAKFRKLNKSAYRQIKRLAYDEPAETFKFDQRTLINTKS